METEKKLRGEVASLEMKVDHLQTQFDRLHELLLAFGFEEGIFTLAESLEEAVDIEQFINREK